MEQHMTMDINALFATQAQPAPAAHLPVAAPQYAAAPVAAPYMQPQNTEVRLGVAQALQGLHLAKPAQNSTYFEPGAYVVALQGLKCIQSNDGKGPLAILEWKVEQSNNPQTPVGTTGSQVIKLMGNRYALSDIRGFLVALLGKNEAADAAWIQENLMDPDPTTGVPKCYPILDAMEKGSMGVGRKVLLQCSHKATRPAPGKPTGGVFTVHKYSALPEGFGQ